MTAVRVPFLDVHATYAELSGALDAAYHRVMESGRYILGHEVEAFEDAFAALSKTDHAIAVGNGLDALSIALRAAGVGPGDEVIVPAHTFIATWIAVTTCGATLVPVDVTERDMLMDPDAAAAACTSKTAAIVPVHLYGYPTDPRIEQFAARNGLAFIGDAAQAHGAEVAGRPVGALGQAATFSFYPAKNLGAFGDGGAITTNDDAISEKARRLRNYGSTTKYEFVDLGVNSRLDPLQAALLRVKLEVLTEWNSRRAAIATRYFERLGGLSELTLPPPVDSERRAVWHNFCVRHPQRDALVGHLASCGIETVIHYPTPPHRSIAYQELDLRAGAFPITEQICETVVSLPIGPHLDVDSVDLVVEAIEAFCE